MLNAVSEEMDVFFVTSLNSVNTVSFANEVQEKLPRCSFSFFDYKRAKNKKFEFLRKIVRRVLKNMVFEESINSLRFYQTDELTPDYVEFVNEIIKRNEIDTVQVEFCSYLPWVYLLPKTVKKVFIHHELRFVRDELEFADNKYGRFLIDYAKDNEISMLNRFDKVVTLSQIDKEKLKVAGVSTTIEVSPLAVATECPEFKRYSSRNELSFVGGNVHVPNYEGIKWFLRNVFPLVSSSIPDVRLKIIGSWSDSSRKEISAISDKVEFLGFVDNLIDGIKDTLMVVPINIGSGIRMKILEASSNSIPFVSTVVGVEGLDFENGKDCLIAQSADEMANQIISVLGDSGLYYSLAKNAYQTFVNKYSFDMLKSNRLSIYG